MGSFPDRVLVVLHSTRKPRHVLLFISGGALQLEFATFSLMTRNSRVMV